jgi:TRAP-type C4-dicarboxylate transport system substrate-binding protein
MRSRCMAMLCLLVTFLSGVLVSGLVLPAPAWAQAAKPEFKLKLMGINRSLDPWKLYEEWARAVEQRTNGRVQFEMTSLPELGFGGAETIRVLKTGVIDVAEVYGGYVAGELPIVEILEMPGIFPDAATAKKAIFAWKPTEAKILEQKANAVLLAMAVYPDQAFFSKKSLRTVEDFKGLKVRVHSVALSSLVAGLGGQPLTVAFAEVYTALERGTLDAGITGTKPGFGLRWYEVSKYLVGPISMRPHVALSINKDTWRKLPADVQAILKEEAERIVEAKAFVAIEEWNQEGITKSVEKGMEHQPFTPDLRAAIKNSLETKVVPEWVKRAGGAEAARLFNEIIAPLAGFNVKS